MRKKESEFLKSDLEPEEIMARIEELNMFGPLNKIDSLAGGDILKWNEISKMSWIECFTKSHMEVRRDSYRKRLRKIMHNKKDNG